MPPVEEPTSFEPRPLPTETRKPKTPPLEAQSPQSPDLVALTVEAATGRIVKLEGVDTGGARQELSEDVKARFAKAEVGATLQGLIEEVFEAGIACALGERTGHSESPESEEDAELSRLLLRSLLERSAAKRFMKREVLRQAIVGALIRQAAGADLAPPENAATH